jgi:ABC-type lipoprotein release transport system permease subunit
MSGVIVVVTMVTTYVPEYRASSVDPMQALRGE